MLNLNDALTPVFGNSCCVNHFKGAFTQNDGFPSSISREDVAIVCVKALTYKEADDKTFEGKNSGDGPVSGAIDWKQWFGMLVEQSDNF